MARKDNVVKDEEIKNLPTEGDEAAQAADLAADEAAKNDAKADAPKAKARSRKVNLDKKLAGKGTFAVGVQAMMRNRINRRG